MVARNETEISRDVIERYARGVHDIAQHSESALGDTLASIDLTDMDLVMDLVRGACNAASQASASYAAQFYRGMSILQTGVDFQAKPMSSYDERATTIAIMAIYKQAMDEEGELDEEMVYDKLMQRISFEVSRASKVGVWDCGQQDSRDVRYARVPTGAETCAWCLMTAGLGFWYMTEEAASHTHWNCDCEIIPSIGRGDVRIDGYDSTEYRDMWRDAAGRLRSGNIPPELQERIDKARRQHESRTSKPWKPVNEELIAMRYFNDLEH